MKAAIGCFIGLVLSVSVGAESLLEGRVRLDSGEPVADAQVRLFDLTDLRRGAIARAMTDGRGYFALPLAALAGSVLPQGFTLGPNYPNPFNPSTIIPYQLAASSAVRLEVFNLLGQHIATLVDGEQPAGFHTATWHATDGVGRAVGAGVYIYRMMVGVERQTGRMVLLDGQAGLSAGGAASVMPGASGIGGSNGADVQVYGLIVSGSGLVPYVDSAFRVESGMAPVELVVSSGLHSAGKATDDDCAFCDLFGTFNNQQEEEEATEEEEETTEEEEETTEEEEETDSTSSQGGPDLVVDSPLVVGGSAFTPPGEHFTLLVTVRNQGDSLATATTLRYYRSTDATISTRDTEVGTGAVDTLEAAGTSAKSIRLTAPSSEGTYYYGACVASVAGESNTDNNCSSSRAVRVLSESSPVTIPDAKLRAKIEAVLRKARGATITVVEMETLVELYADRASISDLTGLEFATNLQRLDIYSNTISDVSPLRNLTNLTFLWLDGNTISDVSPLRNLTSLTVLLLRGNTISDVSPLRNLTNLTELYLDGNTISDVSPLRNLTNLTKMWLSDNNISDVSPLQNLPNLTRLGLYLNTISDISPLENLTSLTSLNLDLNNISDVSPLRNLTNLTGLSIRGNPLILSSINDHIPTLKSRGVAVYFDPPLLESDFDIELVFLDDHFTENHKRVIQYAAQRWMSIIRKDLPDYTLTQGWSGNCGDHSYIIPAGERIDDLRIYIVGYYDDRGLGWAQAGILRRTSLLTVSGCMGFNLKDAALYIETALHEMGHVLGIGTIWYDFGFIQNLSGDDPNADTHFNGPLTIAAFNDAGGLDYLGAKVPTERDGAHWRVSVFGLELMDPRMDGPLSKITIQALADLGYSVDVTQADPYTLVLPDAPAAKPSASPELSCGVGVQREPIYVVDEQGRIVRTISP